MWCICITQEHSMIKTEGSKIEESGGLLSMGSEESDNLVNKPPPLHLHRLYHEGDLTILNKSSHKEYIVYAFIYKTFTEYQNLLARK